jgi:hypothetical protein
MKTDDASNAFQIIVPKRAQPTLETGFAYGGDLVRHRLACSVFQTYGGLRRVKAVSLARYRHDLDAVEKRIGGVVAQHDRRPGFAYLAAE